MDSASRARDRSLIGAALEYAANGWPVLPTSPRKSPLIEQYEREASTEFVTVRRWWNQWPLANPAIVSVR